MPDTIQQKLVDALILRLKDISVVNGYANDIVRVDDWRVAPFELKQLPALNVRDYGVDYNVATKNAGAMQNRFLVAVEIVTNFATTTQIRSIVGDVWKAVSIDRGWGCLAHDTIPIKQRMAVEEDGKRVQGAILELAIDAVSNTFDAYE